MQLYAFIKKMVKIYAFAYASMQMHNYPKPSYYTEYKDYH